MRHDLLLMVKMSQTQFRIVLRLEQRIAVFSAPSWTHSAIPELDN